MNRRDMLKALAFGGGAAALSSGCSRPAFARDPRVAPDDAVGLLFDATRCIGCQACVARCKEVNDKPAERGAELFDAPTDLNDTTLNIIKRAGGPGGSDIFVKRQCMHCVDPACVSACMIGAFTKGEHGIISYDPDLCVGCRYCQVACPFNIPKFEWHTPTPLITKCELCRHRLAEGKLPGCVEACPREAVIYGRLTDLAADAKGRLADAPDRYVQHVYGLTEAGGTQVLYLSGVPFEQLGLPKLSDEPVPEASETIQHGIYQGFIVPAALYVALGATIIINRRRNGKDEEAPDES